MGASSRVCRGAGPAAGRAGGDGPQREAAGKMHFFFTSARHEADDPARSGCEADFARGDC
jgi:hypothetical protein